MRNIKQIACYLAAPVLTAILLLFVFYTKGLFPFGSLSVSWCDMTQQTIPLLTDLKDILDGKSGFFLNMNNAAGMNFYGVFFFFLSSPFSFLVKFVPKADIVLFVNILVVLKLSLCSFTGFLFFKSRRKTLPCGICVILGVMYSLCGYGMLFYQNLMWLDVMYLFPLLMLALEVLVESQNNIPYIITVSAIIVVNYYIGFMVAVFILCFAGVYFLSAARSENYKINAAKFISGTVIVGLLTTVVWLPSMIQVFTSGRGKSVIETLVDSSFLTSYKTILPLLFCSAFIFAVLLLSVFSNKKRTYSQNRYLLLFGLTLIPFFVEPVNIMWHTGNYMSFPARYGFMTVFTGLIYCSEVLQADNMAVKLKQSKIAVFSGLLTAVFYGVFIINFVNKNIYTLSAYVGSLWGNNESFDGLARIFFISVICYAFLYFLYKKRKIGIRIFTALLVCMILFEGYANTRIYMTSNAEKFPYTSDNFKNITDVADKINDDSFYRVATDHKITDYNTIGALGYNTLSHYTSLTDKTYMYTQKRLGLTTVWMEVGAHGGTELTDALYSVKYRILWGDQPNAVYTSGNYSITKQPIFYNLGIVTKNDISRCTEIPSELTRAQVQQYLFSSLYGDKKLITEYDYNIEESSGIKKSNGKYVINNNAYIKYDLKISGRQTLYADCFDRISNDLAEEYFDGIGVYVNGTLVAEKYPTETENGFLKLGTFENENVEVIISGLKNVRCYSFGVFGLDLNVLQNAVKETTTANLRYKGNKIFGSYNSEGQETCIVSVPYNKGFKVKINGKNTEYKKVFSDFISVELKSGKNDIVLSFVPLGFNLGLAISLVGLLIFNLYIVYNKKIKMGDFALILSEYLASLTVMCGLFLIFVAPILVFIIRTIII